MGNYLFGKGKQNQCLLPHIPTACLLSSFGFLYQIWGLILFSQMPKRNSWWFQKYCSLSTFGRDFGICTILICEVPPVRGYIDNGFSVDTTISSIYSQLEDKEEAEGKLSAVVSVSAIKNTQEAIATGLLQRYLHHLRLVSEFKVRFTDVYGLYIHRIATSSFWIIHVYSLICSTQFSTHCITLILSVKQKMTQTELSLCLTTWFNYL